MTSSTRTHPPLTQTTASALALWYKRLVIFALRLGEVPVDRERAFIYLAINERGMMSAVVEADDDAALREIVVAAGGREVVCEEVLRPAARRLGLSVRPLPRWALGPRADLATVLHLGEDRIERDALPAVPAALRAAGELVCHQPWSWLRNVDVIDFEITSPGRAPRHFEGCVMGAGGQEYGVALYDEPGSLERLAKASLAGPRGRAHAIDAHGFTIDGGPAWVADAVAAAYGTALVIVPIRVRAGRMRATTVDELTVMASAAAAAAHLTPVYREHTATIIVVQAPTTATACVRAPRATRRSNKTASQPGASPKPPEIDGPYRRAAASHQPRAADPHRAVSTEPHPSVAATSPPPATTAQAPAVNAYCSALGIAVPNLASVRDHAEANNYALLIVALLEQGAPMTLAQVAVRFEAAGIASADDALRALQRCQPARPPIYRDGDRYALDPLDFDADLWAFRLGLRPPKHVSAQPSTPPPPPPPPRPAPDTRLTVAELDEA